MYARTSPPSEFELTTPARYTGGDTRELLPSEVRRRVSNQRAQYGVARVPLGLVTTASDCCQRARASPRSERPVSPASAHIHPLGGESAVAFPADSTGRGTPHVRSGPRSPSMRGPPRERLPRRMARAHAAGPAQPGPGHSLERSGPPHGAFSRPFPGARPPPRTPRPPFPSPPFHPSPARARNTARARERSGGGWGRGAGPACRARAACSAAVTGRPHRDRRRCSARASCPRCGPPVTARSARSAPLCTPTQAPLHARTHQLRYQAEHSRPARAWAPLHWRAPPPPRPAPARRRHAHTPPRAGVGTDGGAAAGPNRRPCDA